MRTLCLAWAAATLAAGAADVVDIAGVWRFALDRGDEGVAASWFARELPETIRLPGTLQLQGRGDDPGLDTKWTGSVNERSWFTSERYAPYRQPGNVKLPFWLTPEKVYVGAAWYQRDLDIPAAWTGRRVVLFLERPHWGTTVWLDDRRIGAGEALGAPHEFDLGTGVAAGRHRLTIRVDNRLLAEVGINAHSVSDHTQGNWNGIVGRVELQATPPVWLEDVQVFPEVGRRVARVRVAIGNRSGKAGSGAIAWEVRGRKGSQPASWAADGGRAEWEIPLGEDAPLWDEFCPALHRLKLTLHPEAAGAATDAREVVFGLREVSVQGSQIAVNGRPIFLRGTLECCIFPNTGHPPTDVASWRRVLGAARAHGLNHLRFHSWCPPEAAFAAADEMGFYFQVEVSAWSHEFNAGKRIDTWIAEEADRMLRAYGNHPSFLLMAPSNEPGGPKYEGFLGRLIAGWQAKDPRRLYTAGSGWPSLETNQYHVTPRGRAYPTHVRNGNTAGDYAETRDTLKIPVVHHEIGQYCVFPNLDERAKYTGWLKAKNFDIVSDFLEQAGMRDQAQDFLRASGRLQTLFYKEEIEACLRTPRWGGFQLLDLHDFPGQGTALVGVLDPFWESKGYVTPDEYRRFCGPVVPLARMTNRILTAADTLAADVEIANYGGADLRGATPAWRLRDTSGRTVASGRLGPVDLPAAAVTTAGRIEQPLANMPAPAMLNLEVALPGAAAANDWNLWVYPAAPAAAPASVHGAAALDDAARGVLRGGGRVLLLPGPRGIGGGTFGSFTPVFWNKLWFPSQKRHTLGLLCDPKHPALAAFPTAFHADWEWQDLMDRSRPVVLDRLPKPYRPIVQVIDDWNTCRKLGLVFEVRVGGGGLLVCSADLASDLDQRPAARQLRASLLAYMAGPAFKPATGVSEDELAEVLRPASRKALDRFGVKRVRADSSEPGFEPEQMVDGNPDSMWHTAWTANKPGFPHEFTVELEQPAKVAGVKLLPRQDGNPNGWIRGYDIRVSDDGRQWSAPTTGTFRRDAQEKTVLFAAPATARFLRVTVTGGFDDPPFASLAEFDVVPAEGPR